MGSSYRIFFNWFLYNKERCRHESPLVDSNCSYILKIVDWELKPIWKSAYSNSSFPRMHTCHTSKAEQFTWILQTSVAVAHSLVDSWEKPTLNSGMTFHLLVVMLNTLSFSSSLTSYTTLHVTPSFEPITHLLLQKERGDHVSLFDFSISIADNQEKVEKSIWVEYTNLKNKWLLTECLKHRAFNYFHWKNYKS